jgi:hypothetical protein
MKSAEIKDGQNYMNCLGDIMTMRDSTSDDGGYGLEITKECGIQSTHDDGLVWYGKPFFLENFFPATPENIEKYVKPADGKITVKYAPADGRSSISEGDIILHLQKSDGDGGDIAFFPGNNSMRKLVDVFLVSREMLAALELMVERHKDASWDNEKFATLAEQLIKLAKGK